ncbi:transposase [Janthinobacterium sp. PAMC25594]|nr:transposase [Janthinobacterium sp. PAMC25594]
MWLVRHRAYCRRPLSGRRGDVARRFGRGFDGTRWQRASAREHGVNANQVFSWRRLYQQGRLGVPALMRDDGLLPVVLTPTVPAPANATADTNARLFREPYIPPLVRDQPLLANETATVAGQLTFVTRSQYEESPGD